MLVIFPWCHKENVQIRNLLTWIGELDGQLPNHKALLLASSQVKKPSIKSAHDLAAKVFGHVEVIQQFAQDERGWPRACNAMFRTAHAWIQKTGKCPFFWNEPDCIPIRSGWLDLFEHEYISAGKPFMGCVTDIPLRHLTGCAIYPAAIERYNPDMIYADRHAWDVVSPHLTLPHTHHTKLFHHEWGQRKGNIAPTFPNFRSLDRINPEAVLMHRNKDHTLISRLRDQRLINKIVSTPARIINAGIHLSRKYIGIKGADRTAGTVENELG